MVKIKSYSDLKQSKVLSEILSIESADMYWYLATKGNPVAGFNEGYNKYGDFELPCWSLSALLSDLPTKIVSHETAFEGEDAEGISDIYYKRIESTEDGRYMCCYSGNGCKYKCVADNPLDACYEMILKLNELKML